MWQEHASRCGGFKGTTLVVPRPQQAQWEAEFALHMFAAVSASMTRIVVPLERYSYPDAGKKALRHLCLAFGWEPTREFSDDAAGFHEMVQFLRPQLRSVDIVVAYSDNVPLTGMHGMSGTAALLGDLESEEAQACERSVSSMLHALNTGFKVDAEGKTGMNLLAPTAPALTFKDLARNDAAGNAGGLGFALLALGARAVPLNQALLTQFGLSELIDSADVIVVKQDALDGPAFAHSTLGVVAPLALVAVAPVVAVVEDQIMGARELAAQGIATAYVVNPEQLEESVTRIARSWTPQR